MQDLDKKRTRARYMIALLPFFLPFIISALLVHLGFKQGWSFSSYSYCAYAFFKLKKFRTNSRAENGSFLSLALIAGLIVLMQWKVPVNEWVFIGVALVSVLLSTGPSRQTLKMMAAVLAIPLIGYAMRFCNLSDAHIAAIFFVAPAPYCLFRLVRSKSAPWISYFGSVYWLALGIFAFFIPLVELLRRTALVTAVYFAALFVWMCLALPGAVSELEPEPEL